MPRQSRALPRLEALDLAQHGRGGGGPWGYADLLEAIKEPKHERHAELTEWVGDDFDPDDDEAEALTAQVALLAKTWSRTPVKKRTRGQ